MGALYRTLAAVYRFFTFRFTTEWETPFDESEPCVFIANHSGAYGPLEMTVKFPLRDKLWLWCNEGILDRKTCPDYVRGDWWWPPESKLAPLYTRTIPYIAAAILPAILKSAPTIPVWHDARVTRTLRASMKHMAEGDSIVIFPEQPDGFQHHTDHLSMGWLNLCAVWRARTGKTLRIVPVNIDYKRHVFRVKAPLTLDPDRPLEEQSEALERALLAAIRGAKG